MVASIYDPISGHVGGPLPSIGERLAELSPRYLRFLLSRCFLEYCIESVPEMDFDINSKPPKGELLLRGPSIFHGYFKKPEETRKVLMKDGW